MNKQIIFTSAIGQQVYQYTEGKTYVNSPAEAPEGVALKTGPKGGKYYDEPVKKETPKTNEKKSKSWSDSKLEIVRENPPLETPKIKGDWSRCFENARKEYWARKKIGQNPQYHMGWVTGKTKSFPIPGTHTPMTQPSRKISGLSHAWIEVDGKTIDPTPFKPGTTGETKNEPDLFGYDFWDEVTYKTKLIVPEKNLEKELDFFPEGNEDYEEPAKTEPKEEEPKTIGRTYGQLLDEIAQDIYKKKYDNLTDREKRDVISDADLPKHYQPKQEPASINTNQLYNGEKNEESRIFCSKRRRSGNIFETSS